MTDKKAKPANVTRTRTYITPTRRQMLAGMAATAGVGAMGATASRAFAAGSLNYVGWEGYDTFLEAGDIAETVGATLEKTFISTADEVITKLRLGSSQVDLCTPYFIHDDFLVSQDLLEPIDLAKVPNFEKLHPVIRQYCEENMSENGSWYSVPVTYGSICMMYNADKAEKPTSWTDMLKDEYKGKVAITSDYPGNFYAWARVAGVENPNRMTRDELSEVTDMLINLKKNHLRTIASSYGELINLLANEEIVMCQGWEPVSTWVGDSVDIRPAYPKEKCMGFIEGYSIGKGSSNIDAAHAYIDHAISVEGQLAGAEWNTMPVVNADAMSQVSDLNDALYDYANIESYFTEETDVVPMYPLESDGELATWDEYQEAWERVLKG